MNNKIIISISIVITVSIIIFSLSQSGLVEEEASLKNEIVEEEASSQYSVIEKKLKEIEKNKIKNDQSENPYIPKEREWIKSGPFMIDRSEYLIGEKIFINIVDLNKNEKGEIIFFKFLNNTHVLEYKKIGFDGAIKQNSNIYVSIQLKNELGLCTADQLVGNWGILFTGVSTKDLEFKIKDRIIPGIEDQFEPVC